MEFILRLQCDDVLGAKFERETPTGLGTIATAAPQGENLAVNLLRTFVEDLLAQDQNTGSPISTVPY